MNHVITLLCDYLIKYDTINANDRELYEYAIYNFLLSIAPLITFMLISRVIGMHIEGFFLIFSFMLIRKFSGGYHAKHAYICFFLSTGILCISLYVVLCITDGWILYTILCISFISLVFNSPIDSENKKIRNKERKDYQRVTCLLTGAMLIIYTVLVSCNLKRYALCIAISVICAALLQLPIIFSRLLKRKLNK